jgi:mannose-6-phosphate isomerase-like protein (cupin superfamily)
VTVLSGRVVVNIDGKSTTFESGGFYVNPPDVPHSLRFEKESVLQLTCEGPWELRFVE